MSYYNITHTREYNNIIIDTYEYLLRILICMMHEYHKNILDLIDSLKKTGLKIISIEQAENATTLNNFKFEKNANYAFVFGNEINGVSQEVINASDEVIEIPQYGTKHSFNISVSVGIVLWDVYNKIN